MSTNGTEVIRVFMFWKTSWFYLRDGNRLLALEIYQKTIFFFFQIDLTNIFFMHLNAFGLTDLSRRILRINWNSDKLHSIGFQIFRNINPIAISDLRMLSELRTSFAVRLFRNFQATSNRTRRAKLIRCHFLFPTQCVVMVLNGDIFSTFITVYCWP